MSKCDTPFYLVLAISTFSRCFYTFAVLNMQILTQFRFSNTIAGFQPYRKDISFQTPLLGSAHIEKYWLNESIE